MMGLEQRITTMLREANAEGRFQMSLVCTEQGLLVAAAGDGDLEDRAALAALFDDVVLRARRDLGFLGVEELTIRDRAFGHLVLRPLPDHPSGRMFLVAQVPPHRPWRRTTNRLTTRLVAELGGLVEPEQEEADGAA